MTTPEPEPEGGKKSMKTKRQWKKEKRQWKKEKRQWKKERALLVQSDEATEPEAALLVQSANQEVSVEATEPEPEPEGGKMKRRKGKKQRKKERRQWKKERRQWKKKRALLVQSDEATE